LIRLLKEYLEAIKADSWLRGEWRWNERTHLLILERL
jgi:hypothetical protein